MAWNTHFEGPEAAWLSQAGLLTTATKLVVLTSYRVIQGTGHLAGLSWIEALDRGQWQTCTDNTHVRN